MYTYNVHFFNCHSENYSHQLRASVYIYIYIYIVIMCRCACTYSVSLQETKIIGASPHNEGCIDMQSTWTETLTLGPSIYNAHLHSYAVMARVLLDCLLSMANLAVLIQYYISVLSACMLYGNFQSQNNCIHYSKTYTSKNCLQLIVTSKPT